MELNHNNADGVRDRLRNHRREDPEESEERRKFLQKYARILTGNRDIRLQFGSPARIDMDRGDPIIYIPVRPFEQPLTEYAQDVFNLMMQETLSIHEIGHELYTDFPSFKKKLNQFDEMKDKAAFKEIWNGFEDGAEELQLKREFNVEDEFDVMYANLTEDVEYGREQDNGDVVYTMHQALIAAILDLAVYDSETLDKIRDDKSSHRLSTPHDQEIFEDFLPEIEETRDKVLSEPNGRKRNEIIYEFFQKAQDLYDESHIDGKKQAREEQEARQQEGETEHPMPGMPNDADGLNGAAQWDAMELEDGDIESDMSVAMPAGGAGEQQQEGDEGSGGGQGGEETEGGNEDNDGAGSGEEEGNDEGEDTGSSLTKENVAEKYEQELKDQHARDNSDDRIAREASEAEKFGAILSGEGAGDEDWDESDISIEIPDEDGDVDRKRKKTAIRETKRLEKVLNQQLLQERKSSVERNRLRGDIGRKSMLKLVRNNPRAFEDEVNPDEKDYDIILVVDRSGSMGGDKISNAEVATYMLAQALYNIGINVSVIDLYRYQPRLSVPFGVDPRYKEGNILAGETGGGTPLSKAIYLARQRVLLEDSHPAMIVVTDGKPGNPSRYQKELDKCTFPVIGVYIGNEDTDAVKQYYNKVENIDSDNLGHSLRRMITKVVF